MNPVRNNTKKTRKSNIAKQINESKVISNKANDLLLEIGTEEIPASFLAPATETLKEQVCKFLKDNRISFGEIKSYYTPRRLTLLIYDASEKQKEEVLELQGPPKKQAFDEQGNPTKVAIGFASAHNLQVKDLYIKQTQKGEYIFIKKKAETKTISHLLKDNLSEIVSNLQFPKTMRWERDITRFARPIRWITLLYGSKPISAIVAGLKSSEYSEGHRNSAIRKVKIPNAKLYEKTLKKYDVIVSAEERKEYIKNQLEVLTQKIDGRAIDDEELLDETTNICEMPNPILCEFRPEFLDIPSAVLITALKTHTRSFAVIKSNQAIEQSSMLHAPCSLLPYFIAITNTPDCDTKQVAYWYEEAVEARLEDAKFFFEEDVKFGLDQRVEEEKKVVWVENLGTLYDKTLRLQRLSSDLTKYIHPVRNNTKDMIRNITPLEINKGETKPDSDVTRNVKTGKFLTGITDVENIITTEISNGVHNIDLGALTRAAFLCKADLLTNMVREKEYTSLQGIMGGIYAKTFKETDLVAQIIAEHYQPKTSDSKLPKTNEGCILSIVDKIDNIVGAYIVDKVPSGSFDPFGLRRQAIAVYAICLEKKFYVNLESIIESSFNYFNVTQNPDLIKKINEFFLERLNALLLDRNIKYDVANAVLAVSGINALDAYERAGVLTEFRQQQEFEPLVIGQKRVSNILKGIKEQFTLKEELLKESAEKTLYNQTKSIESKLLECVIARDYKPALEMLLSLRPAIDSFFDRVLVMTEDTDLKNNRLGLLQYIKSLFMKVCDLSEIVV